ncbi:hypothetical protein BB561_001110 [Smittium simulii]|uniref:CCHC-type domain-containing protein n=1 Tax=Smittium simulii TaxID=133385 RepID=A0A2T9YW38_9FUNG|nr:hypothetical protein BB561_001110 [Smittium simulii]
MSNVPGVIPSAAAEVPLTPTKRTRLEYSTVAKTAFNPQEFTEVSIMHLLDNSIPKALKKACYGGSNTKIGCSCTQFSGNINAAIDYVALKIDNEYVSYQHASRANATYFMFYNKEALTYRECKPVCSFCKQQGHWKSDCPEIQKFKQNNANYQKKVGKNAQKIGQNIVGLAPKSATETKTNNIFADINKNINQEAQKKSKEPIAPQVKAIKGSTKPNKLQSLEFNNKSKVLISKENIDRFTEFNSIKQLEESNLELSDQFIYADSSCPFTPNFKKEWNKSDENYTKNNVSVAVIDMDLVNELADNNGLNDA